MSELKLNCEGITHKEARELLEQIKALEGVESANIRVKFHDTVEFSESIKAAIDPLTIVVHLAKEGGTGVVIGSVAAATAHLYKKIGEDVIDKAWDWMKTKCTGKSQIEMEVKLYDADGNLIKKLKNTR